MERITGDALADLETVLVELSKSGGSLAFMVEREQTLVHVMMSDGQTNDLHAKDIEPIPCPNLRAAIAKAYETVGRERSIEYRIKIEVARRFEEAVKHRLAGEVERRFNVAVERHVAERLLARAESAKPPQGQL